MNIFQDLLQFIFSGLTSGAIYSLIALGFCVVHNTMGIVNFVQVDFVTLGGMFLFTGLFTLGLPMPAAVLFATASVTGVAMLVERIGIRPSRSDHHLVLIFLTIGISIILRGIIKLVWGKNRMAVPPLSGETPLHFFGATIMPQALWILALTTVAIGLLVLLFRRTRIGLAMRGVASNERAAAAVGLHIGQVKMFSFGLAGALGGLAGVLVTPITTLNYDVGVLLGLKGFAGAILGGFGSFPGAIVGGLGLGLLESLTAGYLSSAYKDVVAFIVLLLVLFIRPRGLLK
ncbi:branched-chain amino acid ABC transporter permease [Desulfolithobacter dissulfuricans]|uniref:Branched-chain amino acid ABC transporter permease n=1 Tax=Desulfolithobacter dissulfuricans TaxID=2795293 RepID=A0A915U3P3_9BACT|nr:branched-chain amino acid ABC transporter permease [Desulfolithobacter dissulfuricans]BCO10734.1 branched-chain amino acid ABC transporter permease [Desulfolithobacter dissulfuricans]